MCRALPTSHAPHRVEMVVSAPGPVWVELTADLTLWQLNFFNVLRNPLQWGLDNLLSLTQEVLEMI